jgi:hypothetical protein
MGNERTGAVMTARTFRAARVSFSRRTTTIVPRHFASTAAGCVFFMISGIAAAQPTVTLSPPIVKGQQSSTSAPSAVLDQSEAKRIEVEREFRMNRIIVEGFRHPDDRTPRPEAIEQRFSTSLNRGSPELIVGKMYDGCYYDGSYFSCADPLSSALRNLRHAIR